jgi:hypothetical protein
MGSSLLVKAIRPGHWAAPTGLHDSRASAGREVDGLHAMVLGRGGVDWQQLGPRPQAWRGAGQDTRTRQGWPAFCSGGGSGTGLGSEGGQVASSGVGRRVSLMATAQFKEAAALHDRRLHSRLRTALRRGNRFDGGWVGRLLIVESTPVTARWIGGGAWAQRPGVRPTAPARRKALVAARGRRDRTDERRSGKGTARGGGEALAVDDAEGRDRRGRGRGQWRLWHRTALSLAGGCSERGHWRLPASTELDAEERKGVIGEGGSGRGSGRQTRSPGDGDGSGFALEKKQDSGSAPAAGMAAGATWSGAAARRLHGGAAPVVAAHAEARTSAEEVRPTLSSMPVPRDEHGHPVQPAVGQRQQCCALQAAPREFPFSDLNKYIFRFLAQET